MIYFFYGDEEFYISNAVKELKSGLDKEFVEMSYKEFSNPKFPDLIAAVSSQPMMFGKMLIVIDCINYFKNSERNDEKSSFDDEQLKHLEQILNNCPENLDIVFRAVINPDAQKKTTIDKRKKIFKLLSKFETKEFNRFLWYETDKYENWIIHQGNSKDLVVSKDVASMILARVGQNLRMLDVELDKLKTYVGNKKPTTDDVKLICVNNEDLFTFVDLIVSGNMPKALEEYQKLLMTRHPLQILSSLHTTLHKKIQLKAFAAKYSQPQAAQMLKIHPYKLKIELEEMKNVPLKSLVKLKENLADAEYRIKSGKSDLTPEREVEYALLR